MEKIIVKFQDFAFLIFHCEIPLFHYTCFSLWNSKISLHLFLIVKFQDIAAIVFIVEFYDFAALVFSCDQAAIWLVQSVRLSVRLSVTPFSPCSHHRIIMKFSGVITMVRSDVHAKGQGQRSKVKVTEVNTQLSRCRTLNSSLNSHMAMKSCTQLEAA